MSSPIDNEINCEGYDEAAPVLQSRKRKRPNGSTTSQATATLTQLSPDNVLSSSRSGSSRQSQKPTASAERASKIRRESEVTLYFGHEKLKLLTPKLWNISGLPDQSVCTICKLAFNTADKPLVRTISFETGDDYTANNIRYDAGSTYATPNSDS